MTTLEESEKKLKEQRLTQLLDENSQLRSQLQTVKDERDGLGRRVDELEALVGKRHAPVRFAIIRFAKEYPVEWIPPGLDGRWFPLEEMDAPYLPHPSAVARAVDFFEAREDGQVGQVFEISMRLDQAMAAKS